MFLNFRVVRSLCDHPKAGTTRSQYMDGYTEVNVTSDGCGTATVLCYTNLGDDSVVVTYEPVWPDDYPALVLYTTLDIAAGCPVADYRKFAIGMAVLGLVVVAGLVGAGFLVYKFSGKRHDSERLNMEKGSSETLC